MASRPSEAGLVAERAEARDPLLFVASGAVEIEHERSRIRGRGGDVQESVTVGSRIEGSDASLGAATGRSATPGARPNRRFGTRAGR